MIKLLRGDLIRLFKSKTFWLGVITMLAIAAVMVHSKWSMSQVANDYIRMSDNLLAGAVYIGIVIAVFTGIYIGTDYSGGTIRNKLVMGHSRAAIYLSDLIVCVTASLIMHIAYIAVIVGAACVGIPPKFSASAGSVAAQILISIFSIAALSAVLLFVSMLIPHRAAGVVSAIVLSLLLIISASEIHIALREKEYRSPGYTIISAEDGSLVTAPMDPVKNPGYVTGAKRKVFEFINNVLPNNQINQMMYGDAEEASENGAFLPLYSLALTAVVTTAGIMIFRKKDLK